MITRCFSILATFVNLLFSQSAFSQNFINTFYSEDFENTEGSFDEFESIGLEGAWQTTFAEDPDMDLYEFGASFPDDIGNPNKAVEIKADLSSSAPLENPPSWSMGLIQLFDETDLRPTVLDLSDPDTLVRLVFDLWTSQTSPVQVGLRLGTPDRTGHGWPTFSERKVTNSHANLWQSHSIDSYAFGRASESESRQRRAQRWRGISMRWINWNVLDEDWGHNAENIFRLDNVRVSIIPETSTYVFVGGCLIAFATFQKVSKSFPKSHKENLDL